ncbi:MAG: RNA methyltransferase [Candidatus Methanomethylicota archaeon]|uniref:RNA methyltransferase n=1 Tax=Thermoproteota archaeon TaxID=2056631 RepID=A0A497EZG0_9CREN|nr:MAG: RNA methyltransferase [Candidatus Verstraetearchaeota archaeon]
MRGVRKLRHLEIILEKVKPHPSPSPRLEQYTISARAAAKVLWFAGRTYDDIEGKVVLDFACGTGRLGIGAALLGAEFVVGVDVDVEALSVAVANAEEVGVAGYVDFLHASIESLSIKGDTVIQNPPFGVQRRGADRAFLRAALSSAPVVYSLHKAGESNRRFILKFVSELGGVVTDIVPLYLEIPHMFEFHFERRHKVKVDLYRILAEK